MISQFPICLLSSEVPLDGSLFGVACLLPGIDFRLQKLSVASSAGDTPRDGHIREIKTHGRIAWQRKNGYGLRAHAELAMQRYKRIIGPTMKAPGLTQQKTEAWISASALNIMSNLGMPVSVKI